MARGKYFTEFERNLIRYGHALGKSGAEIARAIGRTDTGVRQQIKAMETAGTLGDLPLPFEFDQLAGAESDE